MNGRFLRALCLTAVTAACTVTFTAMSHAAPFDGSWSVSIFTRSGACDPSFRTAVTISNGVVYGGGAANISGRVSPNGAVSVSVSGPQGSASGSGRLSRNSGGGSWRGRGSQGGCAGTWSAARGG
ncbi:MAG: hypothetical protein ACJ8F3_18630 [Xanthobacteraceae bacterium]